jgi:excisionase family DNA binding protein
MARRPGWRAIKRHRSYTYDEAARTLRVHKNTIAHWAKSGGLQALTEGKPHIILGCDLIDFLKVRKAQSRTKLKPGEFYCLGCKVARRPAERLVQALPGSVGPVNLRAICPTCERLMHRRVARNRIGEICAGLDVSA